MRSRTGSLKQIFFSTLYLSAFTFGGGYVIVSLLKKKFVDDLHWISEEEMLDLVAIAQSSPGAIAVNGAIVIGYRLAGIPGVLVAVLGSVIPPVVILTVISAFYRIFIQSFAVRAVLRGMTAGVAAVILSVVWEMASGIVKKRNAVLILVMLVAFALNYFLHVNVVWLILGGAGLGGLVTFFRERTGGEHADNGSGGKQAESSGGTEKSKKKEAR